MDSQEYTVLTEEEAIKLARKLRGSKGAYAEANDRWLEEIHALEDQLDKGILRKIEQAKKDMDSELNILAQDIDAITEGIKEFVENRKEGFLDEDTMIVAEYVDGSRRWDQQILWSMMFTIPELWQAASVKFHTPSVKALAAEHREIQDAYVLGDPYVRIKNV